VKTCAIGSKRVLISAQEKSLRGGSTVKPADLVVVKRLEKKEPPTRHADLLMPLAKKLRIKSIKSAVQQGKTGKIGENRTIFTDILDS
jgi:hypothetical protein